MRSGPLRTVPRGCTLNHRIPRICALGDRTGMKRLGGEPPVDPPVGHAGARSRQRCPQRSRRRRSEMSADAPKARHHRGRRIALWIVVGILLLLVVAYLGIGAYAANSVTLVEEDPENPASGPPGIAYQDVSFTARGEELGLAGWYLPRDGASKAVVLVHGRDANRRTAMRRHLRRAGRSASTRLGTPYCCSTSEVTVRAKGRSATPLG